MKKTIHDGGGITSVIASMAIAMAAVAGASDVFMPPTANILWRTAPSATFEVPVFLPYGASSATLVVTGDRYRREYTGLADGMFPLSLPAADSAEAENVYDLELTFNDRAATTHHALGLCDRHVCRLQIVLGDGFRNERLDSLLDDERIEILDAHLLGCRLSGRLVGRGSNAHLVAELDPSCVERFADFRSRRRDVKVEHAVLALFLNYFHPISSLMG